MSAALVESLWQLCPLLAIGAIGFVLGRKSCPDCAERRRRLAAFRREVAERRLHAAFQPPPRQRGGRS